MTFTVILLFLKISDIVRIDNALDATSPIFFGYDMEHDVVASFV